MSDVDWSCEARHLSGLGPAEVDLAALVAARLCHDLGGPLGAIGNGVELLALSSSNGGAELDLIGESVENAAARLRLFRIAFGPAAPGQIVGRAEVAAILRALARGARLIYDWEAPGDLPRVEVRALFLLLQCLESAMPMGGRVVVRAEGDTWEVVGESTRLRLDEALWSGLLSPGSRMPDSAALVQFALLPGVLASLGRSLALRLLPDRIVARF